MHQNLMVPFSQLTTDRSRFNELRPGADDGHDLHD
jgi:hypothetical protein